MKIILILISFLLFEGCRDNSELSMERGEYYYSVDRLEDAVLEYTKVINSYPYDLSGFDSYTIAMVANAHHNLSVIWFKRGYQSEDSVEKISYLGIANVEAKRAYYLQPKDSYKATWDKIQKSLSSINS